MEAGLREEQPTPPPADSPQRHNSALSNAGCSSGAGASDVPTFVCDACHGEFPDDVPKEAVAAEALALWGSDPGPMCKVCDECFAAVLKAEGIEVPA